MKRLVFPLLAAAVMVGCKDDEPGIDPVSRTVFSGMISSSDYALVDMGTRAMPDEGMMKFEAGEQIGLGGDVMEWSRFTADAAGVRTKLSGTTAPVWSAAGKVSFVAVAPYVDRNDDGSFAVAVPAEQHIVDGRNTASVVMVASAEVEYDGATDPESVDLTFKPVTPASNSPFRAADSNSPAWSSSPYLRTI